jgi:hypothetical protein
MDLIFLFFSYLEHLVVFLFFVWRFIFIIPCLGGELKWTTIVTIGLSNVIVNALAMGISEFLSSKAHREFALAEKRRALWEFKHYRSTEIDQMIEKFIRRGMNRPDAELVVNKMAQYEELFVTVMVNEELGFGVPDDDDGFLLKDAFVMCISYLGLGALPVGVCFAAGAAGVDPESSLALVSLVCASSLFVLGAVKSSFNSSVSWVYSGLETLLPGCTCAGLSYAIARVVASCISKFF